MDDEPLPQRTDRRRRRRVEPASQPQPALEPLPIGANAIASTEEAAAADTEALPQRKQRRRGASDVATDKTDNATDGSAGPRSGADAGAPPAAAVGAGAGAGADPDAEAEAAVPLHLRQKLEANNDDVRDDDARNDAVFKPSYTTHPRPPPDPETLNYEYLDHTADVQLHSWGASLEEAFGWATVAMFGYMTDIQYVDEDPARAVVVEAEGHDLLSLLYNFMDACLLKFCLDELIICRVDVHSIRKDDQPDAAAAAATAGAGVAGAGGKFHIRATAHGEQWDLQKHPQGTEVKAITYSNMQVTPGEDRNDIYVIVDI